MATFRVFFSVDNDAFQLGNGPAEAARILRKIAADLEGSDHCELPQQYLTIHDVNGNNIGRYAVKED